MRRFADATARGVGSPRAFYAYIVLMWAWALAGPFFHFSDTWQLIANTTTTLATTGLVFILQYTQNRDTQAIQVKLDELIRALAEAHDDVIGLEDQPPEHLEAVRRRMRRSERAGADSATS